MEPSSNRGEREKSLETFENLIHDIRLIEKQFRSIEIDRGSPKILKEISIDQKTDWINRKFGKTSF